MKLFKHLITSIAFGFILAAIYLFATNDLKDLKASKTSVLDYFSAISDKTINRSQLSFSHAVNKAAPSVVTIYTQRFNTISKNTNQTSFQSNLGSGVIITKNGLILTNSHVIKDADNILVHLNDGRSASAIIVGEDKETDIAILKIPFRNLKKMKVRSSDDVNVGDVVLAIGNPLNVGQTVTMGIISATGRNRVGINTYENFIQTDASINPGNSGGALIDTQGDMIGLNTAIFSQSGGSQGIGFAIPTNIALDIMQELLENGRISRGWFGVNGAEASLNNSGSSVKGVLVTEVYVDSPAFNAGLKANDIITHINNEKISTIRDVVDQVASFKPGTHALVGIQRQSEKLSFDLLITERPTE